MRWSEEQSRKIKGCKPFEKLGFNFECILPAPFLQAIIIVITTALLQTYALTVIVSGLVEAYMKDLSGDAVCNTGYNRWISVIHYKFLALFCSLVVTFCIGSKLRGIQCDGLNKMMNEAAIRIKSVQDNDESNENQPSYDDDTDTTDEESDDEDDY